MAGLFGVGGPLGPISPGLSGAVNPLAILGAGIYQNNPLGAYQTMGNLQQAGMQMQQQQLQNQRILAQQAAELELRRQKQEAAIAAMNQQQAAARALVDIYAPQAGQAAENQEDQRQRAGLMALAAGDPGALLGAYSKGQGPFEAAETGFEGTGMSAQAYNTLMDIGPKINDGTATKLEQQRYRLAYGHVARPQTITTPQGTYTTPPIDLSGFPEPVGGVSAATPEIPSFTPKSLTAAEFKEQTQAQQADELIKSIDDAIEEGAGTGPVSAARAYAAATPWLSWTVDLSPAEAKAASSLAALEKMLIAAMRGAAVGPQEEASFRRTLPSLGQSDELFDANLETTKRNIATLLERGKAREGQAAPTNAPVSITSDTEYDQLPSGQLFIGPDGVERRKP